MPLKQFITDFRELGKEISFRYDVDFLDFQKDFLVERYYSFDDLFDFSTKNKVDIEKLDDDFFYTEIGNVSKEGDIEPVKLNFNEKREEEENYYKKIEKGDIIHAEMGDILIAKVRPNLKKYVLIDDENQKYFYTSAFVHLVPKKLNKILYYSFRTIFYENLIAISRQGKGYPALKEDDFYYLKFDKKIVDKLFVKQGQIVAEIEPIEKKIKKLKNQIIPPQEIINKVFAREFGFELEKFEELKQIKNYYLELSDFANNKDIRQSVKFHREAGEFVISQLKKVTDKKLKHFLAEPIVLGKGVSPSNYDDSGDYFYVSMANIKNWKFETEDAKLVSNEYANENKNKTVAKNDILIARSGEGTIGKVALIDDEDLKGIFADFTMRVKLQNYNYLFAYYYFRTEYFQYLIEVNKKGLGNNTNIFPGQIQEFPMINISLKSQQKIVNEIKAELDKQDEMEKKIETQRNEIDEIIEKAIA
jgi:restriction endonuclease S subunit